MDFSNGKAGEEEGDASQIKMFVKMRKKGGL